MKRYIFPIFITMISLLAGYFFYVFWQTPTLSVIDTFTKPNKSSSLQKSTTSKDMFQIENNISKENNLDGVLLDKERQRKALEEIEDIARSIPTIQEQKRQTKIIYESLTPEDHEETLAQADEAFEVLDTQLEVIEEALAEEKEVVTQSRIEAGEPSMEEMVEANVDAIQKRLDNSTDIEETPIDNEELPDPSQEDISNL